MNYAIDRLRQEAIRILREDEALGFIISPAGRENQIRTEINRSRIAKATKRELQRFIEQVRSHIRERRDQFGVKASPSKLISFLEEAEAAPSGQVYLLRVAEVRSLFHDYAKVWPESALLPAHAYIFFDVHGMGPDGQSIRGIRILEASIYENMAALWNLLQERSTWDHLDKTPPERKTHYALCQATLATSIYFIEAYLNGLAFDHLAAHTEQLTIEEKSILSDYDFARDRPRYLSLRDKVLRYQRIILGVEHAPLQPTNDPPLQSILDAAELIRNPLAHPTPHFNPRTGLPDKEFTIYRIEIDRVKEAVDSSIRVAKRLEELIYGGCHRIPWLLERTPASIFPAEAFD